MAKHILLIEDTPSLARIYQDYLTHAGYTVSLCETGKESLAQFKNTPFDAVLLDLKLPDTDGMTLLRDFKALTPLCPVVMMTAHGSLNNALEAMKLGAQDFLVKPFDKERLLITLKNVLDTAKLKRLVDTYEETTRNAYQGFIGSSLEMQAIYRMIESAAQSKATVFITGESGTGKEVCARAIHDASPRAERNFVALNCGAIPKELMESEIFGHIKGAFTGALVNREGAATLAEGGTLFLDEICEMDLQLQTKLLRFLQMGTFTKVGSNEEIQSNIRIVCATNKDPLEFIKQGKFREDLYYRLHVIPIHLPPLRERGSDILEIAQDILNKVVEEERKSFIDFTPDVMNAFLAYEWPGNIRQLQNIIRNVVVLQDGKTISIDMFPTEFRNKLGEAVNHFEKIETVYSSNDNKIKNNKGVTMNTNEQKIKPLWIVEKETIEHAINLCGGNIPKAAAFLEISPSTIYRKKAGWPQQQAALKSTQTR